MAEALAQVRFEAYALPLVANVTAQADKDPIQAPDLLVQQVTGRVRWAESMVALAETGVTQLIEIGSGKVLSGLAKRCDPRLSAMQSGTVVGIEALIN